MATTTNYGWTTPDDTALVKDGAAAIRTLGSSIDTSLNTALGTKKAGLVLLNTTSFSAVASQSINDVFSSTYDFYRVMLIGTASAAVSINLRLRVSGTDATGSNYTRQRILAENTGVSGARSTGTAFFPGDIELDPCTMILDIGNPNKASFTSFNGQNLVRVTSGTVVTNLQINTGQHELNTAYTGFTVFPSSGTITGSVYTYGYNK